MPYRKTPFVNGEIYHVFNRGVAKLPTFKGKRDYQRFLNSMHYYQFEGPKPQLSQVNRLKNLNIESNKKIVEIICYCLMPNHFHLLVRQLRDDGISEFIGKISNSYTKYFNIRHERVGPLFQGQFKAVRIEDADQLLHVSRYIHLNPLTSFLIKDLREYDWSSYLSYLGITKDLICDAQLVMSHFKSGKKYEEFVLNHKDYALKLKLIEHLMFD